MKRMIAIGGGTGLYTLLRGVKHYDIEIYAIVSMTDSGGSSKILMDAYRNMLPPGDVIRAILALSDLSDEMLEMYNHRFNNGPFEGHTVRNAVLTAIYEMVEENWEEAIKEASRIFNVSGTILPVTTERTDLCVDVLGGGTIVGETYIDTRPRGPPIQRIYLSPRVSPYQPVIDAIRETTENDLIVMGPGDLFTSVICNLLFQKVQEAIRSSEAKKVYVCNLMTEESETDGFSAEDHLDWVNRALNGKPELSVQPEPIVTHVLVNKTRPNEDTIQAYSKENSAPVDYDISGLRNRCPNVIEADLSLSDGERADLLYRHDPDKLAEALMSI